MRHLNCVPKRYYFKSPAPRARAVAADLDAIIDITTALRFHLLRNFPSRFYRVLIFCVPLERGAPDRQVQIRACRARTKPGAALALMQWFCCLRCLWRTCAVAK